MGKTQKILIRLLFLTFLLLGLNVYAQVEVDVTLSPAGSFKAKTVQIKGHAVKRGSKVFAKNILVNLRSLKTGIELRDRHTLDYLNVKKFPVAVLVKASGEDGKGEGIIKIKGIQKPISGTYELEDNKLKAKFNLKLSDFDITGIRYMGVGVKDEVELTVVVPVK